MSAALVGACTSSTSDPTASPRTAPEVEFQRCDPERPFQDAHPSVYRDTPFYLSNEQPIDAVRAWARDKPGYQEIWIDPNHNFWISVGFSENAAARQSELEEAFPDVGVVALEVRATLTELRSLRAEVGRALSGRYFDVKYGVPRGLVEVWVPELDAETRRLLEPLAGPMLYITSPSLEDPVPEGPQPTEGDGRRLIATGSARDAWRTGIATSDEQYVDLLQRLGLEDSGTGVDFETEIAVWFGTTESGTCPIRMDDVVIDLDQRLIHPVVVIPGKHTECTDDAKYVSYIVAIPRDRLPVAPFLLELGSIAERRMHLDDLTTVHSDLRSAGSPVTELDLEYGYLMRVEADSFTPEHEMFLHDRKRVWFSPECTLQFIGPIDGIMFRTDDPALSTRPVGELGEINHLGYSVLEIQLRDSRPRLMVFFDDRIVIYEPVAAEEALEMPCL
ncbi:MAG: hypothetical protein O3C27_09675 [Actinomycetota bacterium]|nr:hypothetical protein [Actinomycetota bacterium]